MSRNSPAAKPPSRHVEDLLEEGPVPSNFQARGSPGLLASSLPPPGNRKGRSCVIQRRQNPGEGPREDAHDLIPRVVLCQPVLVDDEDGESQDRPVFVSQDVPAQHLEALVAVASHGHAVAPQPDAGHGLWADKGSGRGCMLLELAGLEVAPVAKGLISSTLLVHDREHLVGEQHGQHGPDVLLLFAVEHHGFEPVQWGPVGVLAQVGPNVSGLWDSILSSLADAGQASDVAGASGFRVPGQLASIQSREGVVQKEATHPASQSFLLWAAIWHEALPRQHSAATLKHKDETCMQLSRGFHDFRPQQMT